MSAFVALPDGGRLSYARFGQAGVAPPLVLLRPLGGSMALWGAFAARLAMAREVIAFDPRGVGESSDAPWWQTTRAMAGDVRALLAALRVERADVFGLSLGGMVATWLAIDAPTTVVHLVLASTLPRAAKRSHRIRQEAWPMLRALVQPEPEVAMVRAILSSEFCAAHPERLVEIDALVRAHPTSARNLVTLALATLRHDAHADHALAQIAAPTLILIGGRDPIVGDRADGELLRGIAGAALTRIATSGHDLSLEAPDEAADAVLRFLADPQHRAG